MRTRVYRALASGSTLPPWSSKPLLRDELFGIERLEQYAQSLAAAHVLAARPPAVYSLARRLNDNAAVVQAVCRESATELKNRGDPAPAEEWLLDNLHFVEVQIVEIRDELARGCYRRLPSLSAGPLAGYPRVLGLVWAFVAHTDSCVDPDVLRTFIAAYQRVQPLTIGEVWAVPISVRIVLIEHLRLLAEQIRVARIARGDAGDPGNLQVAGHTLEAHDAQPMQDMADITVRNVITSMRIISGIDWVDQFERLSLVDGLLNRGGAFAAMDFPTRNQYRSAIEQLARGSPFSDIEIASLALRAAQSAAAGAKSAAEAEQTGDPGYHLIAEGRRAFERTIGFRPTVRLRLRRLIVGLGIGGYAGAILLFTLALLAIPVWSLHLAVLASYWRVILAILWCVPASEVATVLVNRAVIWSLGSTTLPGLALQSGVPRSLRTLVAVPILLTSEASLQEQIRGLEVHYLAGGRGDLTFALLSDGTDAEQEVLADDARLLEVASKAITELNRRYGPGRAGSRFLLLHRRRAFNPAEGKWMGWERKRGKLHELNRLLRGATDTSYMPVNGHAPQVPDGVRYVITLDADTRLPRDAAMKLIGKMAHPLNRPVFDEACRRVVRGYAILQPRVTPSLPVRREGSLYQRVFAGPGGIDPYAAAVSDVYQDLFGEGSYTGKGIYDIDAFEAALTGRVPENALLSHDLFEGIFARAGLASDVEVVEEFPTRYDVAAKRQHRWTRGDWQLLEWIFGKSARCPGVPIIGRWKMLDNLRRSLLAPFQLIALGSCWLLPKPFDTWGSLLLLAAIAFPAFLPPLLSAWPFRTGLRWRNQFRVLVADLQLAAFQTFLALAFLPDQAWRMGDAIARTLVRLYATRRRLLEWTTAAQCTTSPRLRLAGFYQQMAGGTLLALSMATACVGLKAASWWDVLPFALLWCCAPVAALWVSGSPTVAREPAVSDDDARELRLTARRTWRFFETFVTPADNMLPPDNFQETPQPALAHRTSPSNIGLYLLSAVAARDFGWTGTMQTIERLEATLGVMRNLPRCRGHLFNWYCTRDLRALAPAYISSVDSGNLAGHLIVLANACEEWCDGATRLDTRLGIADTVLLAREAGAEWIATGGEQERRLGDLLDEIDAQLGRAQPVSTLLPALISLTEDAVRLTHDAAPAGGNEAFTDVLFWIEALREAVAEHGRDQFQFAETPHLLRGRLKALADTARAMALEMDFAFLFDAERKLLSIGYSLDDNKLDSSCYDLLASEARLASLMAIAKGDVATRHWLRLGRAATPLGNGSALISWSGSMFEYLMPSLVMRAPVGSLLEQTNRLVVARQQAYGQSLGIPWGMSESAYSARDMESTYQYSNFGVPGLGLKQGLAENVVIAPYATGLAAMVDPLGARQNYSRLKHFGACGRYGFYEALDFTRARLRISERVEIVRSFMAHHQGMTIVAIANALHAGLMRERFHREPMVKASELLLQERSPRNIFLARPKEERDIRCLRPAALRNGASASIP